LGANFLWGGDEVRENGKKIGINMERRSLNDFTPPPGSGGSRSGFVGEGRWEPQRHGWDCTQRDSAMQSEGRIACCENAVAILAENTIKIGNKFNWSPLAGLGQSRML